MVRAEGLAQSRRKPSGAGSHGSEGISDATPSVPLDGDQLAAYREALDKIAIVAMTDVRGRIVEVNDQFSAISGYTVAELIGSTHSLLNSGHHPRSFFDALWKTISTGKVWRGDICNRAKCGRLYWVDTTIAPLRDPVGRLRGYLSIRFDITDRKIAETKAQVEYLRRQDSETLLAGLMETMPLAQAAPMSRITE